MIPFIDTSALIKLYVAELGSESLRAKLEKSTIVVSQLSYAEVYATFARRLREGLLKSDEVEVVTSAFEQDWGAMVQVPFSDHVARQIRRLCLQHPLRGADAFQLACAAMLRSEGSDVTFIASDRGLLGIASADGFAVFDPEIAEGS